MNIDLIMALVSLYQLSPEKRYLPLRLIIFTHALVYSTDFLIFVACIVWGFNQIHTRFQTAIICIGFDAPDCISWTIIIAPWPLFE